MKFFIQENAFEDAVYNMAANSLGFNVLIYNTDFKLWFNKFIFGRGDGMSPVRTDIFTGDYFWSTQGKIPLVELYRTISYVDMYNRIIFNKFELPIRRPIRSGLNQLISCCAQRALWTLALVSCGANAALLYDQ